LLGITNRDVFSKDAGILVTENAFIKGSKGVT